MTMACEVERAALSVLVVNDKDLLATSLVVALQQVGVTADSVTGTDPARVIAAVCSRAPVIVLLDLDLGPSVGPALDLIHPVAEAGGKVVVLHGISDRLRLAACLERGATGFVSKTAEFADLVDTIGRVAAGDDLLTARERETLMALLHGSRQAAASRLAPFARLTPRERAVLGKLMAGESAQVIAAGSYVSLATVRAQIQSILRKLDVRSQLAAVALARRVGWSPGGSEQLEPASPAGSVLTG